MYTGKQKQMNASYQASLVNRHIRRFTGIILHCSKGKTHFHAKVVSFSCHFYKNKSPAAIIFWSTIIFFHESFWMPPSVSRTKNNRGRRFTFGETDHCCFFSRSSTTLRLETVGGRISSTPPPPPPPLAKMAKHLTRGKVKCSEGGYSTDRVN